MIDLLRSLIPHLRPDPDSTSITSWPSGSTGPRDSGFAYISTQGHEKQRAQQEHITPDATELDCSRLGLVMLGLRKGTCSLNNPSYCQTFNFRPTRNLIRSPFILADAQDLTFLWSEIHTKWPAHRYHVFSPSQKSRKKGMLYVMAQKEKKREMLVHLVAHL